MTDAFNLSPGVTNIPEMTVSELSGAVKRTIEDSFGYVRVRGELSKVTIAKSGHLYTTLKDDGAVLDGVCWKGTMARLPIKPEEGLEVICTGRLTTYPGRSNYQLVIENMELAGLGAIMKMLEARKAKLAAEGLFAESRKQLLPYLPRVIGVVTSPTGAVIRDILHRIADRFPVHVIVWPVNVQGDKAAGEVIKGIQGFNALPEGGKIPRPDLIIVARGGGSFEDLLPFWDEGVVRAAAASDIALISAVGHETDVTLIDFAADVRAPTPTAAAEMAVPVRANLMAQILDDQQRLLQALTGRIAQAKTRLDAYTRTFTRPQQALEGPTQKLDRAAMMLDRQFEKGVSTFENRLLKQAGRLRTPHEVIAQKSQALSHILQRSHSATRQRVTAAEHGLAKLRLRSPESSLVQQAQRLDHAQTRLLSTRAKLLEKPGEYLTALSRMLESLSFHGVLSRGYTIVQGADGKLVTNAASLKTGDDVSMTFATGKAKAKISDVS